MLDQFENRRNLEVLLMNEDIEHITLADRSSAMLAEAPVSADDDRIVLQQCDSENLAFAKDETYDTVLETFGLCSVDAPKQALAEMVRVCKPNG